MSKTSWPNVGSQFPTRPSASGAARLGPPDYARTIKKRLGPRGDRWFLDEVRIPAKPVSDSDACRYTITIHVGMLNGRVYC